MKGNMGKCGIAIRNQIYECSSGELVSEEAEHRDYGTEANFYREGIRLTRLSRYVMQNGTLLVPNEELNCLLSICNLWEKRHRSLPGERSYGHSWCGLISVDYYDADSDTPRTIWKGKLSRHKDTDVYNRWEENKYKLEEQLNERFKNQLSTPSLDARITRFELELQYKDGNSKALLTEYDVKAVKDFVSLYRKRRKKYK
ncbi:MAG: hypothetical protein PHO02_06345 [Candidatus Nanoarchaeia archaeon]|nr:hypothetical protein [Candidatus Nanoarchaeia archaeon]